MHRLQEDPPDGVVSELAQPATRRLCAETVRIEAEGGNVEEESASLRNAWRKSSFAETPIEDFVKNFRITLWNSVAKYSEPANDTTTNVLLDNFF